MDLSQRVERLEKQFLVLHTQQQRIISDIESEKDTRARVNIDTLDGIKELDKRVRLLEKAIWIGIGVVVVVEFLLKTKILP